ncbi:MULTISPECIES: aminotransferase class III-fold pyridoxal phosphate-dependent enzyme [unclassified Caballeronia]|uniref:aminotransferase class III-fold pyridoxal phosphate-dependent enzyme n=1 Tax=unclassified Caballeronia TaxID=2646786 RepID=UPI002859722F|nr:MULTISPECIES: aminotransferase class III-fold pyridoxal phosphate-dependent enzyme [unclassified Caballeronia]MDR5753964.1 aminotransferase class III-fold pyridoxal phosphate-dependent enzyme [Caballeronia sp. LZ024]MDR5840343.1 aminotransferase class III-fold pyridoxal phosphate-dependent enzyme [Caballeronia sp. LZ031]
MTRTKEEVSKWLAEYVRASFNIEWNGNESSLADLGVDSLSGAELVSALEGWLEISIPVNFLECIADSAQLCEALVDLQSGRLSPADTARPFEKYINPYLATKLAQLKIDRTFVRAAGAYLYDEDGRQYLDFLSQYGAVPFGHHPAEIWSAVERLRDDAEPIFAQPSFLKSAGLLAQRLIELAPPGLRYVTFSNSGAEAVEAALKMARHATNRTRILSTKNGFHGKTFGALSATGKLDYQTHFGLPLPGFDHIEYASIEALEAALSLHAGQATQYAAFVIEPIQGEGGVHVPPSGYLREVEAVCRRHGVLLIVDEIQTGLGRTGALFACENEGVRPDILTLSKTLGGGMVPVAATLCTDAVYSEKIALKHSSTFAGNAFGARVGLATLDLLTRNGGELLTHVRTEGAYLKRRLEQIRERHPLLITEICGQGFMLGIRFTSESLTKECFLGLAARQRELAQFVASYLLNAECIRVAPTLNRGDVLRVQPPLNATRKQCDMAADAIGRAMDVLAEHDTGKLYRAILQHRPVENVAPVSKRLPASITPARTPDDARRFAFLLHPLDARSYADYDTSLAILEPGELAEFARSMDGLMDPVVGSTMQIESATGTCARGDFIMIPHTSEQLRRLPQRDALAVLKKGIELGRSRGARIVGLGAYTSIVSGGGVQLLNEDVALTSGNSYTVVAGLDALDFMMRRVERRWDASGVGIVGAAGAIGSCMAVLLSRRAARLILIGNPAHEASVGRARLVRVAKAIVEQALAPCPEAFLPGSLAQRIRQIAQRERDTVALIVALEKCGALVLTDNSSAISAVDVAVTATSFPGDAVNASVWRTGTIVCDISRPRSVHESIVGRRPDVLVIDGGIIALPGKPRVGPYGLVDGTSYACMAETMLLALEGRFENTSIGNTLDVREISAQQALARKHGFALAGLQSFGSPLTDALLTRFVDAAVGFTSAAA